MRWVRARWSRPAPAPAAVARYTAALAPVGITEVPPPRVVAGEAAEAAAAEEWAAWRPGRTIALAPGARHFTKRWPEAYWVELVSRLRQRGESVLCLGLEAERRALPELERRLAGDSGARWCTGPLPQMAALLPRCAGAISGDSGLMHLAAARGVRVVALFGSTAPELGFAPAGEGHVVLCRHEPCQPCTLHGRAACPKGHFRCMLGLRPEEVIESLDRILASPGTPHEAAANTIQGSASD
jgi:heptosyltransferase-2